MSEDMLLWGLALFVTIAGSGTATFMGLRSAIDKSSARLKAETAALGQDLRQDIRDLGKKVDGSREDIAFLKGRYQDLDRQVQRHDGRLGGLEGLEG